MVSLTNAGFEDYAAIASLHAENWRHFYRGILSERYLEQELDDYMLQTWRQKLGSPDPRQQTFLAVDDTALVGFACLVLDEDEQYGSMLDNLHVSIQAQQKGIGRMLMQACAIAVISKASNHQMWLWVYEKNENAIEVYKKLGGTHAETVVKPTAEGTPAVVYRFAWADVGVLLPG